jgi:hypothetical protein
MMVIQQLKVKENKKRPRCWSTVAVNSAIIAQTFSVAWRTPAAQIRPFKGAK